MQALRFYHNVNREFPHRCIVPPLFLRVLCSTDAEQGAYLLLRLSIWHVGGVGLMPNQFSGSPALVASFAATQ